jgi:hypothetical protein
MISWYEQWLLFILSGGIMAANRTCQTYCIEPTQRSEVSPMGLQWYGGGTRRLGDPIPEFQF